MWWRRRNLNSTPFLKPRTGTRCGGEEET